MLELITYYYDGQSHANWLTLINLLHKQSNPLNNETKFNIP